MPAYVHSRPHLRLEALRGISGATVPRCRCCRERREWTLVFDHIAGGGTAERKALGQTSTLRYVRREWKATGKWPTDRYQVLCATCNHGKRVSSDGRCPHEHEEVTMLSKDIKPMAGTLVRVFVAAMLAAFLQEGADIFSLDNASVRAIISSGISAAAVVAFNYFNPKDTRYGLTQE